MPGNAALRKKKIGKTLYWFTKAGGVFWPRRFSPLRRNEKEFTSHLQNVLDGQNNSKRKGSSADNGDSGRRRSS